MGGGVGRSTHKIARKVRERQTGGGGEELYGVGETRREMGRRSDRSELVSELVTPVQPPPRCAVEAGRQAENPVKTLCREAKPSFRYRDGENESMSRLIYAALRGATAEYLRACQRVRVGVAAAVEEAAALKPPQPRLISLGASEGLSAGAAASRHTHSLRTHTHTRSLAPPQ